MTVDGVAEVGFEVTGVELVDLGVMILDSSLGGSFTWSCVV